MVFSIVDVLLFKWDFRKQNELSLMDSSMEFVTVNLRLSLVFWIRDDLFSSDYSLVSMK